MTKLLPLLGLALALASPSALANDRAALARTIIERTVAKNLGLAFKQAEERSLASLPAEKADRLRPELDKGFEQERAKLVDELSKEYAQKFSDDELKQLLKIYDDPVYQKFQAVNADPNSLVSSITKDAVTRMMNMLALATMAQQQPQPGAGPAPKQP
ncbi:hypothetical protein [Methylobacterium nodulans]|uniref:DUF2059 domain-containing protein n=1 Tax=Methylobacterium nodulans (strain LMG 21967 / CNCM I-2342 / ORS 2060) TaxID=460265 RepID=B8IL88_METNO|nr:hypothetical protein [Methylobacterium nodulans]ACL60087.1 conserved hypothetical protein [Methylobacterium nodulans ORS 2060]